MGQDVKNYCGSCLVCARSNNTHRRLAAPLEMTTQPTAPWQHIAIDLIGPFGRQATERGNRYVLVTLDLLTKGVELAAIPDKSAVTLATSLIENVVYRHGLPESILTDRGLEFKNQHLTCWGRKRWVLTRNWSVPSTPKPWCHGTSQPDYRCSDSAECARIWM